MDKPHWVESKCGAIDCNCCETEMPLNQENLLLELLLAQRGRARRDSSETTANSSKDANGSTVLWQHRGDGSDDGSEDEDENGFVLPPGWTSVRQAGADGGRANAFTWTDGTRSASSITRAWEMYREGSSGERGGGETSNAASQPKHKLADDEGDLLTDGVSVAELLDSLLLSDDELSAGGIGEHHFAAPGTGTGAGAGTGYGSAPGLSDASVSAPALRANERLAEEAQISLADLPESELGALLQDEELQGQLLEMLTGMLEDGVSGLGDEDDVPPRPSSDTVESAEPAHGGSHCKATVDAIDLADVDD